jgi:hypothetical protein
MSTKNSPPALLRFDKWLQEWATPVKKLTYKEASKALEELEKLVDEYFVK